MFVHKTLKNPKISHLQASLYSVRWYYESEEFYRYVPTETPPGRTFYVPGLIIDVSTIDLGI